MVWLRHSLMLLLTAALVAASAVSDAQTRRQQTTAAATRQPAPSPQPGNTSPEMRIAAVVNDQVISVFDLASRVRMVMISSNLPDTEEIRQRLASQVLRSLIDEKIGRAHV